jgi:ABC-type nickel/cobalt efflux system permease component RcnA
MLHGEALGLLIGAVALGAVHGIEPGHGWPVAASYALDQANKWVYGFAASFILGVGHLISSIAMVAVFFYAKSYFNLTQVNEPISLDLFSTTIHIGGPVSLVAGVLLIALGIREYFHGHSHGTSDDEHGDEHHDHQHDDGHSHGHGHDHDHDGHHAHGHEHDHAHRHGHSHDHDEGGLLARLKGFVPFVGGHSHSHGDLDEAADRGLLGIAWFAFVLGFAHEEEFEIIALCAGSNYCLELMSAYAITVIVGIVGLTMLLIAGYHRHEEKVKQYTPYLPAFSAAVLIIMGIGFITGIF